MDLQYRKPTAILDPTILAYIDELKIDLRTTLGDQSLVDRFCQKYIEWIKSSSNKKVIGLDGFPHFTYSHGTTEAFDKFYMKNHTRRFRCFKGEYMYHQLAWRNSWPNWQYLDDKPLDANDAVIISAPFADTGDLHPAHESTLAECDSLGVPVLIDCAYYNLVEDIDLDLSHPSITEITFSLSKTFPIAHARVGLRLTRVDDDDPLFVLQKTSYNNRIGAELGLALIEQFDADYLVKKYKDKQLIVCSNLDIMPSKTVIFGIGDDRWAEYNRGMQSNRIALNSILPDVN